MDRYRHACLAVTCLALLGCYNVGPAPKPLDLVVGGTPADVIRTAARSLVSAEFEVTHSEVTAGILQARRVRGPHGNDAIIKCAHDRASTMASNLRSTVALTVSATGRGDSSVVKIATVVTASYPGLSGILAVSDNETDCVSTGVAEAALVESLRSGSR